MSNQFVSSPVVDVSKEREWGAQLGLLDWDSTSIVFTKRSLIEFLRYTGTTVDTNFANIQKLPRYAKFGKITASDEPPVVEAPTVVAPVDKVQAPNRKHTDIFAPQDDGALANAPPPPSESFVTMPERPPTPPKDLSEEEAGINFTSQLKPSRRVREQPGGPSSMSNLWSNDAPEEYKPSRRVREQPGGRDQISSIF